MKNVTKCVTIISGKRTLVAKVYFVREELITFQH